MGTAANRVGARSSVVGVTVLVYLVRPRAYGCLWVYKLKCSIDCLVAGWLHALSVAEQG